MDGSSVNLPKRRRVLNPRNTNPNLSGITSPIFDSFDQKAILWSSAPKDIFHCNVGDSHAAGQLPITFFRQIMAGLCLPCLLDDITFPTDVKRRVKLIRNSCHGHSVGSYSDILGIRTLREAVADFIEQRDESPSNIDDIFLTCGATEAIRYLLCLLSTGLDGAKRAGIMLPIPQFPFYSATITEFNLYQIGYYLDEARNWDLNPEELTRALTEARDRCIPRAIVVINPGNPTGQVLSRESMEQVIRFAVQHGLVLLADEVYQFNVHYPEFYPWISFKRVLHEMGAGFADRLEMASFMSCSKGYAGECGFRGGYCELINFDPDVRAQLYKALSIRTCPPVLGQAMVGCLVNPPKEHEPSYAQFAVERDTVLENMRFGAAMVNQVFDTIPGLSCTTIQGAIYAFPSISLSPKAIKAAEECGQKPDVFYCLRFLEEQGVCVVSGSGFGQADGTYHFRMTILPFVEQMKVVLDRLMHFHTKFLANYTD